MAKIIIHQKYIKHNVQGHVGVANTSKPSYFLSPTVLLKESRDIFTWKEILLHKSIEDSPIAIGTSLALILYSRSKIRKIMKEHDLCWFTAREHKLSH